MLTSCLHTHINDIQCKYADLAYQHSNALSIGRVCTERESYIKIVASYLQLLYCYKTFDAQVTYAYNFKFNGFENTLVSITIGTDTFSATIDSTEALQTFLSLITASTDYDLLGFISNNVLYIYSYDTNLTFGTTTTVSDEDLIVTTNMEDTYNTILDIWNCITSDQVCSIINNAKKLTGQCNCN